ncbi:MAG: GTPase Era, partial [Gammaproteobacteria bacterium]|nr:GTPase Era [Gammaproteobacteria bacterium]
MADKQLPDSRSGYVAIVGKPNVGKSTLLNHLVGQKISITSRKPQTTRHRITGILTEAQTQIVFVDTPGMHQDEKRTLNRYMNRAAGSSLQDVDVILALVDGTSWNEDDELVIKNLASAGAPVALVVNKVDKIVSKESLLPHLQELSALFDFEQVFPLSALKGTNVDELKQYLIDKMPQSEFIYPEDYVTDRSMRFMAAELVREKLMRQLGNELPYATTVNVEQYEV